MDPSCSTYDGTRKPAAGSEGESGGFGRRAERQQIQQNALIRREVTILRGSGGWRRGLRTGRRNCNGPAAKKPPKPGLTGWGSRAEGPNGQRKRQVGSEVAGQER